MKKFHCKQLLDGSHFDLFQERKSEAGYWEPGLYDDLPLHLPNGEVVRFEIDKNTDSPVGVRLTEPSGKFWVIPWHNIDWFSDDES